MSLLSLVAKLTLDKSQYTQGLTDAQDEVNNAANGMRTGIATAAAAGAAAVVAFGVSSVKTGSEFSSSMSQLAATWGTTVDQLGDAEQKAIEVGGSTMYSAKEVADAMNILAMSGYNTTDSMAMVEDVLHLAAAGSMDMASAASYVTGTMKGYNDSTKDARYYSDIMALGATLANTSVSQLGEAMAASAATASTYGQTADGTAVALLRLAEQGEVGSAAGTALNAVMKNLFAPTDQAKEALDALGVSAYYTADEAFLLNSAYAASGSSTRVMAGDAKDLNSVVNDLDSALNAVGTDGLPRFTAEQKAAALQTIFGIQGFNAYNKMAVTGAEKQDLWTEALARSGDGIGAAATQYNTMTDNLNGDITSLESAWSTLQIEVFKKLEPTLRSLTQTLTTLVQNIGQYMPVIVGFATAFGTFAIAVNIGPIITKVTVAFKGLFLLLTANPIGVVIAAVAGLAAGLITLWNTNEGFRNKVKEIWAAITGWFVEAKNKIVGAWQSITGFFTDIWNKITGVFQNVKGWFSDKFNGAKDAIHTAFSNIGGWFTDRKNDIENAFSTIDSWSQDKFQKAYNGICTAWSNVKTWASDRWTDIKDAFGDVKGWFTTKFTDAKTGIQGAWSDVKTWASNKWTDISGAFGDVGTWFSTKFTDAKNGITGAFSNIGSWFSDLWTNIKGLIKLPHFKITGSLSIAPPSVPHLSVQWYKKAYDNAMLFRSPTVLGTSTGYKGFGDGNGAEVVLGLNKLKELVGSTGATYNVTVNAQPGQNAEEIAREVERVLIRWQNQERLAYA